jgi:hypothetical protein
MAAVIQIAGHTFADTSAGRICACGKAWRDIASVTRADVGAFGIACHGALTDAEADQIAAERDRIWAAVQEAAGA